MNECPNQCQNVTCYKCGKTGNISLEFKTQAPLPQLMRLAAPPLLPELAPVNPAHIAHMPARQAHAMTFNMNLNETVQSSDMVASTLLVNDIPAKALIDSGATRSFISIEFVKKNNREMQMLDEVTNIVLANQDRVPVSHICPDCEIAIERFIFPVDLLPFKLGEFDVILSMDWLARNDAKIDCKNKKVYLQSSKRNQVVFRGQRQNQKKFLTMIQAKRILRQGCEAYLAHVVDTEREPPS